MSKMVPIVITILNCNGKYLFIKRNKPPYEGLWSLVGGKVETGEHIRPAAKREVIEETGAPNVADYKYLGLITERLVDNQDNLLAHFLIFLGTASITSFQKGNREGELALFTIDEVFSLKDQFLPSDWEMFRSYINGINNVAMFEAELVSDGTGYHLNYYREV